MVLFRPHHSIFTQNNEGLIDDIPDQSIPDIQEYRLCKLLNSKEIKVSCSCHPKIDSIILVNAMSGIFEYSIETFCCGSFKRQMEDIIFLNKNVYHKALIRE
ncbi:MAG: hypothetical protein JWR61_5643 [Ferruginibacter sp.]|nr:hypothetical protein [Ferruginibacter sp.]